MPTTVPPAPLFGLACIAVPVLLYVIVALRRKPRFRATAAALGANYIETGWLPPGKIVGSGFSIEASTRSVGRSSSYRTTVRVSARDMPGPFFISAGFFTGFPNWRHARVRARKRERVFFMEVSVPRWVEPTSEERDRWLDWLSPASVDPALWEPALREARIKEILFDNGSVMTSFGGIVSDPVRLQRAVDLLKRLAR